MCLRTFLADALFPAREAAGTNGQIGLQAALATEVARPAGGAKQIAGLQQ